MKKPTTTRSAVRAATGKTISLEALSNVQGGHICCDPGEVCAPDISPGDCMANPDPTPNPHPNGNSGGGYGGGGYDHSMDR